MMKIDIQNGVAKIFTPYNADFVKKVKNIGGRRWNDVEGCWTVPESEIETVRGFMMDVYGETDLPDASEKVTVLVTFNSDADKWCGNVVLFGKTIARAWGRDSGAKVGDDVTLISGSCDSTGSRANWYTTVKEGTVVKVRNVPKAALEFNTKYDVSFEIVADGEINKTALEEEREKLLARIAEIDRILAA